VSSTALKVKPRPEQALIVLRREPLTICCACLAGRGVGIEVESNWLEVKVAAERLDLSRPERLSRLTH
jgi:hypothetical protein